MTIKKIPQAIILLSSLLIPTYTIAADSFCKLPAIAPTEKMKDELFLEAMNEADYIFKGQLFTYYNEKCEGDICSYSGLVFKRLEDIENYTQSYVETRWQEDCNRVWLFDSDWRTDKEQMLFEINKEYLLLGKDSDNGMVIFGARKGLKLKELMMKYELNRYGG